jgi:hypothetical protein
MSLNRTILSLKATREMFDLTETSPSPGEMSSTDSSQRREHIDLEYLGCQEARYVLNITKDVLAYTRHIKEMISRNNLMRKTLEELQANNSKN